jgi:hypothetical protein
MYAWKPFISTLFTLTFQVEALVDGEPFVSFFKNSQMDKEKLKKEIKETALLRSDEIVKKLNAPKVEKRKRKLLYVFEDF